jgi:hypothetical protein
VLIIIHSVLYRRKFPELTLDPDDENPHSFFLLYNYRCMSSRPVPGARSRHFNVYILPVDVSVAEMWGGAGSVYRSSRSEFDCVQIVEFWQ